MRGISTTEQSLGPFDRMRWRVRSQPSPVGLRLLYFNENNYNNNSYSFHSVYMWSALCYALYIINMILVNPSNTKR